MWKGLRARAREAIEKLKKEKLEKKEPTKELKEEFPFNLITEKVVIDPILKLYGRTEHYIEIKARGCRIPISEDSYLSIMDYLKNKEDK